MKTERRHELATNELADWIGSTIQTTSQYGRAVLATVILLAVVVIVYAWTTRSDAARETAAWDRYLTAVTDMRNTGNMLNLEDVANQYSDTAAAEWARLKLADQQLEQGIGELFTSFASANDTLRRAAGNYELVLQASTEAPMQQRAIMGLAQAYESLNQLDDARAQYEKLTSQWPDASTADVARRRLDDLNSSKTKSFYDWLAQHEPAGVDGPGTPGAVFDLNNPSLLPESGTGVSLFDPSNETEEDAAASEDSSPGEGGGASDGASSDDGASVGGDVSSEETKSVAPSKESGVDAPSEDSPSTLEADEASKP